MRGFVVTALGRWLIIVSLFGKYFAREIGLTVLVCPDDPAFAIRVLVIRRLGHGWDTDCVGRESVLHGGGQERERASYDTRTEMSKVKNESRRYSVKYSVKYVSSLDTAGRTARTRRSRYDKMPPGLISPPNLLNIAA